MSGLLPEQHEGLTGVRAEQDFEDAVRPQGSCLASRVTEVNYSLKLHFSFIIYFVLWGEANTVQIKLEDNIQESALFFLPHGF